MIKSFYEEPIFSSDFQRKDLQVIDKSIQQLLEKNNGVGVVGGFYTPGLPVGIISELALRSLGCHGDEVFGSGYTMQFADCFAEDCDLRDLENFRQFKGKRTLCLHTRDGGWRWFYLCKDEKQLPDGRVMWLLTLCDCNALHKREKWLVEARNSAEAANRAKSSFLSRMSHDIRSPLNGILGMAKIAYDNAEDPEKVRDTMEKLTAAGQQLETLINDVLDISRMESGRMPITHEPFDLYELLARCGDTLHTQVVRMQLTCHVHFNHRHSHVIGSPLHVQRIIANISSNAVKYNRVGGTITVSSTLGEGTTFVIELPLELDLSAPKQPAACKPLPSLNGMKLLLAEDNALNAEVACYLLENAGAAVTVAENGQAALDAFLATGKGETPLLDAILMDVVMPVMDGLQAARAIRESSHPQAKEIPIIAQTANAFAEDVQRTRQAGMNDHISKPLNEAALLRVLAQYYKPQP